MSAEGDMITSALGCAHGSVATVLASSHAMLGTATTRDPTPPAALAHTGGSISSHAQSLLGQSWGWMAWLGLGLGLGLGSRSGLEVGLRLGLEGLGVDRLGLDAEFVHEFRQR